MARFTSSVEQITDINGVPIVGAKKFFFEPGTTIQKDIYTDSGLTVVGANPQLSDADGRYTGDIFLDGLYKEEQQDNSGTTSGYDGVTLWTSDPIGDVVLGSHSLWVSSDSYDIPEIVLGSDDFYYESLTDANQGNNPISSPSNWAKITFVKAGVLDGVSEIKDTNSLTSIILTPTASAVNHAEITNAATGGGPTIQAIGTDTNIDLNINAKGTGVVNVDITGDVIGNLTGDVTGNLTGALTVDVDTITADTLNGDLELTRNGTGDITVDSAPIYGLIVNDTPAFLVNDSTTTATSNTPIDITLNTTGVAVKAIIKIGLDITAGAGPGTTEVLVGEGGETLVTDVHRALGAAYIASEVDLSSNEVTVNLAAGEVFDYAILQTGTAPTSRTVKFRLVGYYI